MSHTRIYQPVSLAVNTTIRLDEKASHHLARVLRAKVGEEIILFNGNGGEYSALITLIDKKGIEVNIQQFADREVESPIEIFLAQGIARGEKMDFIVQKAVELGVKKIIPIVTERCNVRLKSEREEKRLQHWQSVIESASEQSGRNHIPEIEMPIELKAWLPHAKADKSFVLSPYAEKKMSHENLSAGSSILILVGPEGGLSEAEINMAKEHGFLSLNLGPRILRTETAALAAISVLQYKYGDFS